MMHIQWLLVLAGGTLASCLWIVVYRLLLSPLAKVPGPKLAAFSWLYEAFYDVWHKGQYVFKIKKLHEQYGPIIRPVPDEVHINDPDYLDTIYAIRGRNNPNNPGLLVEKSVGGAEDFYLHKLRREALNPFFSQKFMLTMEDAITEKKDRVIRHFDTALQTEEVLNLSDVYFAFSNDLVRNFSLGSDSDLLNDLDEASRQRVSLMNLLTGVKINKHFPIFAKLGSMVSAVLGEKVIPPAVMDLLQFKGRARRDIEAVLNDVDDKEKGRHSVFYELRDTEILPPEEKTVSRLQDEATLIVMAGTESLAKSLQYGTYYLLSYPETLEKLRKELDEARQSSNDGKLTLSTLLALPYLNAILMETNRLTFGVTNRMLRYSPTETLTYTASYGPHKGQTYVFPPGTKMSCTTYCTHTNGELFPDPFKFNPERFIGQSAEVTRRKKFMMALGKGHRRCLGVNLANAGMCLVLASMAQYHTELFETTYEDVAFKHDYQIAHPRLDTRGIRVKVGSRLSI
ncbi:Cytochrome P450 monooxygenase [Pseudocercospora fuligena]|uniref:Cytochrome P450 monooxygenase n=1 Tax=Pseudocercospora fuligena TaxID=685502 RepID=A0A8H6VME6_9PEZI|nr:Cytochrome P450 monooxygenase [Pseudocercospora fuligena]